MSKDKDSILLAGLSFFVFFFVVVLPIIFPEMITLVYVPFLVLGLAFLNIGLREVVTVLKEKKQCEK